MPAPKNFVSLMAPPMLKNAGSPTPKRGPMRNGPNTPCVSSFPSTSFSFFARSSTRFDCACCCAWLGGGGGGTTTGATVGAADGLAAGALAEAAGGGGGGAGNAAVDDGADAG